MNDAKIILSAYNGNVRYLLDRQSGRVEPTSATTFSGFGQWRNLGLVRNRKRAFIATFLSGDDLVLWLDRREIPLGNGALSASVDRVPLLPARHFRLSGVEPPIDTKYWFLNSRGWPDDGDIFSLVLRIVASPDNGAGFVHAWRATSEGKDLSSAEFLRGLDSLRERKRRS